MAKRPSRTNTKKGRTQTAGSDDADNNTGDDREGRLGDTALVARQENWLLEDLKPCPFQHHYAEESSHNEDTLADDIKKKGLRERIQVLPKNKAGLPAGTILDGHRRAEALRRNGDTEVVVTVRYDLAEASLEEIEYEFLSINPMRRHLDELTLASIELRKHELERRLRGKLRPTIKGDVRDRIGAVIGWSGRKLSRIMRIAGTPKEVQDAYRAKKLPQGMAEKVSDLKREDQEDIAELIRDGYDPKDVVEEFLPQKDNRHKKVGDAVASFARALERAYTDLHDRVETASGSLVTAHMKPLKKGRTLLKRLLARAKAS